ncbi:hypothetical protein [Flavobacterium sp.]|uniref:hypothetical protein n=1 Tax=Flavobacterium sp. TaxID=239 RepID=UPI0037539990
MKKIYCFLMFAVITSSFSQEGENMPEKFKSYHSVSGLLSHTLVKNGIRDGNTDWISFPSFAFDYNFVFSPKWRIGFHNDVIFEDFIVETTNSEGDKKELERSEPIASVLVLGFKPGKHFTFEAGMGYEISKEENLFLTRIGAEYSLELPNEFEFIANVIYDVKWDAYDSFAFGIGVSKSFGK